MNSKAPVTPMSTEDFVFIAEGKPYRVRKLEDGYWKCWMHPDKHWVTQRKISDEEASLFSLYRLPQDQAELYEFGLPFHKAPVSL